MVVARARFSGNSNYEIEVSAVVSSQNLDENYSVISWRVEVTKLAGTGYWSADKSANNGYLDTTDRGTRTRRWSDGSMAYDFRSVTTRVFASGTYRLYHDSAGYATYRAASVINLTNLGTGSATTATANAPRIPKAPAKPSITSVTNVGTDRFQVNYKRGATNGTPITRDQIQWATDGSFSNVVWTDYETDGTSNPGGNPALTPGRPYSVRVRSDSAAGWSPWSNTVTQTTLPAQAPTMVSTPNVLGNSIRNVLSGPAGVSGITKWRVEYRLVGGATSSKESTNRTIDTAGLTPGKQYQVRGAFYIDSYLSPYSAWVTITMPKPSTAPGDYFDGSSAARSDVTFAWDGTAHLSTSRAVGVGVKGWMTFDQGKGASGGAGSVFRAPGGLIGQYSAEVMFSAPTTAEGFVFGVSGAGAAAVEQLTRYYVSLHVKVNNPQRIAGGVAWYDSTRTLISYSWDDGVDLEASDTYTRLISSFFSPQGAAYAAPVARDTTAPGALAYDFGEGPFGAGAFGESQVGNWHLWTIEDTIFADGAMVSLEPVPYFDGSTPDTALYDYQWLGTVNESPSIRLTRTDYVAPDPLADPDCTPIPKPPLPPAIPSDCIDDVGVWRRYLVQIPASEVRSWVAVLPTLTLSTSTAAARQVRIRVFANPGGVAPELLDMTEWGSEMILTYIPPQTEITLDGVTQRVWAEVGGADAIPANHLLYGTNGVPASWPELVCGQAYVIALDVPLDAPEDNLTTGLMLTQRM